MPAPAQTAIELVRHYPVRGGAVAPQRIPWWPVPTLPRHRAEVLASREAAARAASVSQEAA
ncbi:MAG: hypothetical protein MZU84_03410 [Sphingobacterium sp.]|nr:hypothetical protein [Sphingobacterium sp.]